MMKLKIMVLLLALLLVVGCSGLQIDDSATHQALAYGAGKGFGIAINRLAPAVDPDLSAGWVAMMARNEGRDVIAPSQMLMFYNDCFVILSRHVDDPYGILSDLGVILMIFGAQFGDDGHMTGIEPVPIAIMRYFQMGYGSGRMVAQE